MVGTSGQQAGGGGHGKVNAGIPLPGYRAPGTTPRGAVSERGGLRGKQSRRGREGAAQGTGLLERQRQVQPEGQRLRWLRHQQRGDQHAGIRVGRDPDTYSSQETKGAPGLTFLFCKLG